MLAGEGPICECEIVPHLGLSQPTVSYHLKVLREAGLIRGERRGQWVYYQPDMRALLGTVKALADLASARS
jgi:ArsR family transcriptional regulator